MAKWGIFHSHLQCCCRHVCPRVVILWLASPEHPIMETIEIPVRWEEKAFHPNHLQKLLWNVLFFSDFLNLFSFEPLKLPWHFNVGISQKFIMGLVIFGIFLKFLVAGVHRLHKNLTIYFFLVNVCPHGYREKPEHMTSVQPKAQKPEGNKKESTLITGFKYNDFKAISRFLGA